MRFSALPLFALIFVGCSDAGNQKIASGAASNVAEVSPEAGTQSDAESAAAELIAKNFVGNCIQNMPRIDKVESAATALGWQELDGEAAAMLGPQEKDAWYRMWVTELEPGVAMMISVARGEEAGSKIAICNVANPYAPAEPILNEVKTYLNLPDEPEITENVGGQRVRIWQYSDIIDGSYIHVSDASPMNEPGVTITYMTPEE